MSADNAERARLPHERAAECARLARLLRRSLRGLDVPGLPTADRDGLERALTALGGDIPLLWLLRGTGKNRGTTKAAPAASPSHWGIESSDGSAAFLGHPAPACGGRSPDPGGPMRRESVAPDAAHGNDRCAGAATRRETVLDEVTLSTPTD